ncbi:hypothetical protein QC823_15595, partial [Halomonas vilamensis]
ESGSCRNFLISQENTIRHLRFQAALMNKPGSAFCVCSAMNWDFKASFAFPSCLSVLLMLAWPLN